MNIGSIDESMVGKELTIFGWVEDKRPLGEIVFFTVRDQEGVIQVVVKKIMGEDMWRTVENLPRQSAVRILGVLEMAEGRLEVLPKRVEVLSHAEHPLPIDPTGRTKTTLSVTLDARPLSLRAPGLAALFKIRSVATNVVNNYFHERGYLEVQTPKIIATATEGGAELFKARYFDRDAYLAQSPQIYKEQLMLGFDRVFEIGQYFRAEASHTVKHLAEFTSVDVEIAYLDYTGVMDVLEDFIRNVEARVFEKAEKEFRILGLKPSVEIGEMPRITYSDCIDELMDEGFEIVWGEDLSSDALALIGEKRPHYYFIHEWPTELKPFYIKEKRVDPGITESFDLMHGRMEIASGGSRVNDGGELEGKIREKGLDPSKFQYHLKFFECGMPPHAGFGFGLDRYIQVLTKRENIREVVLYPRDPERITP